MSLQNVSKSSNALEGISYDPTTQANCKSSDMGSNQRLFIERFWQQRPPCLRPIHCTLRGDQSVFETAANVATSLPFILLGMQAPRKNLNTKVYANSLIGVGIASSLYHASRGKLRKYLRWVDYTMIATTTVGFKEREPKVIDGCISLGATVSTTHGLCRSHRNDGGGIC